MDGIKYSLLDASAGKLNVTVKGNVVTFGYPCTAIDKCTPYVVSLIRGVYLMSLWGAQGGGAHAGNSDTFMDDSGGKGAFVSGQIKINQKSKFFFYVGSKGEDLRTQEKNVLCKGGFNGGGNGAFDIDEYGGESNSGGGGASDIRLIGDDTIQGLKSRIIVAAGGGSKYAWADYLETGNKKDGSTFTYSSIAGDAGALKGFAYGDFVSPGTQTTGSFGKGMDGISIGKYLVGDGGSIGGGGGGYYGGSHIDESLLQYYTKISSAGAGGSSFVSGCKGCNAVTRLPINEVIHSNQSIHYSRILFSNIIMKDGNESFISPFGNSENGHHGNGAISIKLIARFYQYTIVRINEYYFIIIAFMFIICS